MNFENDPLGEMSISAIGPVIDGKQMKPAGWTPPDIEGLLRAQGWEGEDA